jgi:hypothetical protein
VNRLKTFWLRLKGWEPVPETELQEAREEARPNIRQAVRRANYLWDKSLRLPMGSNGRRKAENNARMIAQGAFDLANKLGIAHEFFPGSKKPE